MEEDQDYIDVFEQNGVFIYTKQEENGSDSLLGGTICVTEVGEKRYVRWNPYPDSDKDKENMCTLDGDSSAVVHSPVAQKNSTGSVSDYNFVDPDWTLVNDGDGMVAFMKAEKCGRKRQSVNSETSDPADGISIDLIDISQIKKSKRGLGWPNLTLIRKDGTTLPVFHFHENGCKKFIKALKMYAYIMPSPTDPHMLQLSHHDENALTKSFDELQLFGSNASISSDENSTSKILQNPGNFALRSFSRVTNFLQDVFITSDQDVRPANETAEVVSPDSMEAIGSSRIQIKHGKEQSNGFEVITCAQLGPRSEEPRGPPVNDEMLLSHKDEEGRILRPDELSWAIFKGGIEPGLRKELWKYCLKYYDWNMTKEELVMRRKSREDDYYKMKMQWKSFDEDQQKRFSTFRERKSLIEKDVVRTDRSRLFYKEDNDLSLKLLFDILMTYCMYNFDLGYVQGMSDLLSPLLEVMENEVDAFWCFVGYMNRVEHNFEANQCGMKQQLGDLRILLQFMEPQLWDHLNEKESSNLYFCFRWLLILFKREFSYEDIQSMWEVLWSGLPCYNFHLLICIAILDTEKSNLMQSDCGFTEILKHINDLAGNINVDETLRKAYGIFLQLSACRQDLPDSVRHILGLHDQ